MKLLLTFLCVSSFLYASDMQFDAGEKIYKKTCLSCHGVDGTGNDKVSFIVNPRNLNMTILDTEQTYQIIKKGAHHHGASADIMPSFESVLNEGELRSVTHYIVTAFNPKSESRVKELMAESVKVDLSKEAKVLKRGHKIYKRNCSWCHGLDADGNGDATRNPEMSIFPYNLKKSLLNEEQMFLYTKYGGQFWGTQKEDMPGWARKYDDYTIQAVIKYIKKMKKEK